jgi:GNAT superfamily N-acetyltransferase
VTITLRQAAGEPDIQAVAQLWTEAAAWLAQQGTDQWQYPIKMHNIRSAVAAGSCWLAEERGALVGTITIDTNADEGLWDDDELADAVIVHRMVVARSHAGQGIGNLLLDHAEAIGRALGRHWIRLDAWTNNTGLHSYYQRAGFRLVRITDPYAISTALFERPIPCDAPESRRATLD